MCSAIDETQHHGTVAPYPIWLHVFHSALSIPQILSARLSKQGVELHTQPRTIDKLLNTMGASQKRRARESNFSLLHRQRQVDRLLIYSSVVSNRPDRQRRSHSPTELAALDRGFTKRHDDSFPIAFFQDHP